MTGLDRGSRGRLYNRQRPASREDAVRWRGKERLRDVAEVRLGYQSRGRIVFDPASPYRIIQLRDVEESVDWHSVAGFKPEVAPERYRVANSDVLLASRGGGSAGVVLTDVPENTVASSSFYVIRVDRERMLPEFVAWCLDQPEARAYLRTRTQGTNIPLITKADLGELAVPVPALGIQHGIVDLARLRRTERDLLRQLESRKDLLIQSLCQNAIHRATHTEA